MQKNSNHNISEGLLEFAKYAFAPNYFSYCGPNRNSDIKQAIIGSYSEYELREILNSFEAAVPYLNLIARSNRIKDPFDPRVVKAYWIGNDLLGKVPASNLNRLLEEKVKKRSKAEWREIQNQIGALAKPHHSFHVFDIYRFAGLTRDGSKAVKIVDMMNSCRISSGRVVSKKAGGNILIKTDKIRLVGNRFKLIESVEEVEDIFGIAKPGDLVSVHWGLVCDKLSLRETKNLDFWTKYHLNISNQLV